MPDVQIRTRMFPSGFDISTPEGALLAKRVFLSPLGEIHVFSGSGDCVARLERESFFRNAYNIVITGGGFYRFSRDGLFRQTWTCEGEGRLIRISKDHWRRFRISDEAGDIADCLKAWFFNEFSIAVFKQVDTKLIACITIALFLSEYQNDAQLVVD